MKKHKKSKKRKGPKKPRNMVVLGMLVSCKGGHMKDRRDPKGGSRNDQREFLEDSET